MRGELYTADEDEKKAALTSGKTSQRTIGNCQTIVTRFRFMVAGLSVNRKLNGWQQARRARLRFALLFAAIAGGLLAIYSFPYAEHGFSEDMLGWYLAAYARAAGRLIHITDPSLRVVGRDLIGRASLTIAKYCDAMDINLLLIAAVLASPARWKHRLLGIGVGVAVISAVNLLRIVVLYQISVFAPHAFDIVHAEVFPLGMVACAVGVFVFWTRWCRGRESPSIEMAPNAGG